MLKGEYTMKVILCDKCKGEIIVACDVSLKSGKDVEIVSYEGISMPIVTGKYFCSINCLKESIQ